MKGFRALTFLMAVPGLRLDKQRGLVLSNSACSSSPLGALNCGRFLACDRILL